LYRVFWLGSERAVSSFQKPGLLAIQDRGEQSAAADEHIEPRLHEIGVDGNGLAKLQRFVIARVVIRSGGAAGGCRAPGAREFKQVVTGSSRVVSIRLR